MQRYILTRRITPTLARRPARHGLCRRAFLLALVCGTAWTSAALIRSASGFAPCPGVLRFPYEDDVLLSGTLEARVGGRTDDCWFAFTPLLDSESYTVNVVAPISSNCFVWASDAIPTTTADTGVLANGSASARAKVTFYGTDPDDDDIVGEGSQGTFISAAFHYAADFDVWASDSSCAPPNYPGADGELETTDPLTVTIPFSVIRRAVFDADATLTVGGACVESSVAGTWKIEEVGGGYERTGTVMVDGVGTDIDSWRYIIGLGDYIFTATLDDLSEAEVCLTTCPASDLKVCTHTVDLDIDLEFDDLAEPCPYCP